MTSNHKPHHIWPAEEYHKNSSPQFKAAEELLKNIQLKGNEQILDVGCGDGKISAFLGTCVPKGSIVGVDTSPEMITFAQYTFSGPKYSNLSFSIKNAQNLQYDQRFDVVFSCCALQWVPHQDLFFKGAIKSLRPSGYLVVAIPLGISQALQQSIQEITSLPEWSSYFQDFAPGWHFTQEDKFLELLNANGFEQIKLTTTLQTDFFTSEDLLKKFILPWLSYLNPLPTHLKESFFNQIIDRYLQIEPIRENGLIYQYFRLNITATKPSLNDGIDNIEKYSRFGIQGTSWLAFRDVPQLIQKYVKGKRALDYGCGAGRSTRFLKSLNFEVVGTDTSIRMLEKAKQSDPTGLYLPTDSEKVKEQSHCYDLIFSSFVFLVVDNKSEMLNMLQRFHRSLKDDGIIVIITGSEELHSKKREWLSYDINFPENDHLQSGSLAKIANKDVGAVFYDYNWTDVDYCELFQQADFQVLEKYFPLGRMDDGYHWKSEIETSPHVIYILHKQNH